MTEEIYFNIDNGHFKVWGYNSLVDDTKDEWTIITYWGRVGITMYKLRKNKKTFSGHADAYDYIWNKIKEKLNKGYHTMPNSQYFDSIIDEKPLRQLVNLMEVYKKAQEN